MYPTTENKAQVKVARTATVAVPGSVSKNYLRTGCLKGCLSTLSSIAQLMCVYVRVCVCFQV